MKILIVNSSDAQGGAARASYRLHKSILTQGIDCKMLVQNKSSSDFTVIGGKNKIEKVINKIRPTIDLLFIKLYKNKTKTLFSPSWFGFSNIVDKINKLNPDIVHLHWICGGMIKIEDIALIKAPVVWSLHDMWAFTGGCHYDEKCFGYETNCGDCKVLGSGKKNVLSRRVFTRKKKTFIQKQDITIVGLSNWLNEASKSSALLKYKKHINLPNLIDTNIFKPFNKEKSKELWNLPKNKKLVLYGAMSATSDPRKGFEELAKAMIKLEEDDDIAFVVFGSSKPENESKFRFQTYYLGSLADDVSLVTLYSAVDVMVVPSLQENLSNAIMESLSCGTPVVAFDIGGNSDMIIHQETGYLAKPFDTTDLKNGIEWVLNHKNYDGLCLNAREKVMRDFDSVVVVKKYIELYRSILNSAKKAV